MSSRQRSYRHAASCPERSRAGPTRGRAFPMRLSGSMQGSSLHGLGVPYRAIVAPIIVPDAPAPAGSPITFSRPPAGLEVRFRSSQTLSARSDTSFGIQDHQQLYDSSAP